MEIVEIEQRSPEWYAIHCKIPTASSFSKIITTKGEPSKQKQKYLYQLAGETICGIQEETYQSQAMLRGVEMEAEAREFYELTNNVEVEQVGFCFKDGKKLTGCSPDGLVGADGAIEIKCPIISTHVDYLLKGVLPSEYFQQVQGTLFVTGRKWCDFISYYPGLKPLIVRVYPDVEFITKLEVALKIFNKELQQIVKQIAR